MTGYVKVDADGGSDNPPIERIAPYSQMYSYRASKIREHRDSKAIMNSSDIINSRANSGLSVPLADESKLHYSRRSFDAQRSLSVQRYRQRTQTEISLAETGEGAQRAQNSDRDSRSRSVDFRLARLRHRQMQSDADARMALALDRTVKETYRRVASSKIPWIPTSSKGVKCSNGVDLYVASTTVSCVESGTTNLNSIPVRSSRVRRPSIGIMSSNEGVIGTNSTFIPLFPDQSVDDRAELMAKVVQYRAIRRAPWSPKKVVRGVDDSMSKKSYSTRALYGIPTDDTDISHTRTGHEVNELSTQKNDDTDVEFELVGDREWVQDSNQLNSFWDEEEGTSAEAEENEEKYGVLKGPNNEIFVEGSSITEERCSSNLKAGREGDSRRNPDTPHTPSHVISQGPTHSTAKAISGSNNGSSSSARKDNASSSSKSSNSSSSGGSSSSSSGRRSGTSGAYYVLKVTILRFHNTEGGEDHIPSAPADSEVITLSVGAASDRKVTEDRGILIIRGGSSKKKILTSLLNQFPSLLQELSGMLLETGQDVKFSPGIDIMISHTNSTRKMLGRDKNVEKDNDISTALNDTVNSTDDNDSILSDAVQSNPNVDTSLNGITHNTMGENLNQVMVSLVPQGMDFVPPIDDTSEVIVKFN